MTPEIFAMLVIMALVTTFMTSPALYLIDKVFRIKEAFNAIEQYAPDHISVIDQNRFDQRTLHRYDLLLISLGSWLKLAESKKEWLEDAPSVLILKQ